MTTDPHLVGTDCDLSGVLQDPLTWQWSLAASWEQQVQVKKRGKTWLRGPGDHLCFLGSPINSWLVLNGLSGMTNLSWDIPGSMFPGKFQAQYCDIYFCIGITCYQKKGYRPNQQVSGFLGGKIVPSGTLSADWMEAALDQSETKVWWVKYSVTSGSTNQDGGRHRELWVQGRLYCPKCQSHLNVCTFSPHVKSSLLFQGVSGAPHHCLCCPSQSYRFVLIPRMRVPETFLLPFPGKDLLNLWSII